MTAQVIPVRITGPVQTDGTDSTAAVHQALMAHNVKEVTVCSSIHIMNKSNLFHISLCFSYFLRIIGLSDRLSISKCHRYNQLGSLCIANMVKKT